MQLPATYLLTCPARAALFYETMKSWRASDWTLLPLAVRDYAPEQPDETWGTPMRAQRVVAAFRHMLRMALRLPGSENEWLLFTEDDVEVHPRIGARVAAWPALRDPRCGFATLFNPMLRPVSGWGEMKDAFAADPATFLGAQALLLRRGWVARALAAWNTAPGMQAQRLARLLGADGPIWVHRPSLVQHVGAESSWGARPQRALDFSASAEG